MKRQWTGFLSLMILLLSGTSTVFAQEGYSRVKVYANEAQMHQLATLGMCTDHGTTKRGLYFTTDLSDSEIQILNDNNFQYEILIADVVAHYKDHTHSHEGEFPGEYRGGGACGASGGSTIDYPVPSNFSLGTMGGFHKYAEYWSHIDQMAALYPNLITVKQPISTFQTHEGRDIYWVKISDNPSVDETEPEMLYTALIHAREPAAGAQLIFYMWYLLENYATDPEVQYLVNNTEMYFIPMINPDGYAYNEQIQPNGGGMWRKNRRNNGGGDYGVDLNRNFSYQWAQSGSSNNPGADNYHGPNAFSEPESQAVKWFCENHDFVEALNYHTYGDLLLFPYGWASIQTPDFDLQNRHSGHMVSQNTASNILSADLYPAAGDTDDWMYAGDLGTKPKVFAYTPEVGNDNEGFWPSSNQIIPICKRNVFQNLSAAWLITQFAVASDEHPASEVYMTPYIKYNIQRLGHQDGGTYTVSVLPVSNVASVSGSKNYTFTNPMDNQSDSIQITLDPGIQTGQTFSYAIEVDNGLFQQVDTFTKTFGAPTVIFADNGDNTSNWTGDWSTTTEDFVSTPSSITDSPNWDHGNNETTEMELNQTIDLTSALEASMTFMAKWEIEAGWDYVQLMASTNGGSSWTPLCGRYTIEGNGNQDTGNPLWDGFQTSWVEELVSLNDYLGQTIQLKFRLVADAAVNEDGFYFDDVEISMVEFVGVEEELANGFELHPPMPNPASTYTFIPYDLPAGTPTPQLEVVDALGQLVAIHPLNANQKQFRLNTSAYSSGVYFYRVIVNGKASATQWLSIVR